MKKRQYILIATFIPFVMIMNQSFVFADTAISVPRDAKMTIENAKNDMEKIEEKKKEIQYKEDAADYVNRMQKFYTEAQSALMKIEQKRKDSFDQLQKTEVNKAVAQEALDEAKQAYDRLSEEVKAAYQTANDAYQEAAAIERSSYAEETSIQRMVDVANRDGREITGNPADYIVDWSKVPQAKVRADQLEAVADQLAQGLSSTADSVSAAEDNFAVADEFYRRAEQNSIDLQNEEHSIAENIEIAKQNLQTATDSQKILLYHLAHPPAMQVLSNSTHYYSWINSQGNKGTELAESIYYGYDSPQEQYNMGIFTSLVSAAHNASSESGEIKSLTDTTMNFTKCSERNVFTTSYLFQISLPTGRSALGWSQRNARMSDDLVETEQFGKGWQLQPGIQTSWKPTAFDQWTVGTTYLWSQAYDQTSDISNDDIHPGYEWAKWLRYQHAEKKWQLVSEVINTAYGKTSFDNGNVYHLGNGWKYRLTYNRTLDENRDLLFYYWRENSGRNDVASTDTHYAPVNYYGTLWSKKLNDKRTLRFSFDVMDTNGNRYDGLESYWDGSNAAYHYKEVYGRKKYTFGVGFDLKLDKTKTLNFDVQHFQMKDGASTTGDAATDYRGWNIFLSYNKTW
ncbi:MAG: hypothetical protein H6Q70_1915 [Firmicutes bacterium]|nr:hypothetical protein [Bacillota bacterium]